MHSMEDHHLPVGPLGLREMDEGFLGRGSSILHPPMELLGEPNHNSADYRLHSILQSDDDHIERGIAPIFSSDYLNGRGNGAHQRVSGQFLINPDESRGDSPDYNHINDGSSRRQRGSAGFTQDKTRTQTLPKTDRTSTRH